MGLCKIAREQCHRFTLSNQRKWANGAQMISLASCWHFSGVRAGARPRRHHRHQFVGRPQRGWSGISHTAWYRLWQKTLFQTQDQSKSLPHSLWAVYPEQRKISDRVSIIRPVDKVSPNPICHPSSLWIYLFAEYRKSTRQVKGVVLYTLQLQKWREQWWLVTTVCEWGKEKLQIWSWGSLSTFKWWLYKYSCSRTTGPVFGIERGNSSLTACQKQLFSHKLLFSRRYKKAVLCQAELKDIGVLGCFDWLLNRKW